MLKGAAAGAGKKSQTGFRVYAVEGFISTGRKPLQGGNNAVNHLMISYEETGILPQHMFRANIALLGRKSIHQVKGLLNASAPQNRSTSGITVLSLIPSVQALPVTAVISVNLLSPWMCLSGHSHRGSPFTH